MAFLALLHEAAQKLESAYIRNVSRSYRTSSIVGAGKVRVDLLVSERDDGLSVDRLITQALPDLPRRTARAWIQAGRVAVDRLPRTRNARLQPGQLVTFDVADVERVPVPAKVASPHLVVRYEDDHLLVVDKPAGMVVHPAYRHGGDTLFDALLAHAAGPDALPRYRPGLVHRLDKDTSGLVLVTKTLAARAALQRQLDRGEVTKEYLALASGQLDGEGAIDVPLGRDPADRRRVLVSARGQPARTRWSVRERLGAYSLVELRLETGRTHQIRAHLAAIGAPIAGDAVYGGPPLPGLARQFLHAHRLAFQHPVLGHPIDIVSPLPPDLASALDHVRHASAGGARS